MKDLNSVIIVGRLTRDPEIKYTPSGQALANLSIASNASYTQNNEAKEYVNYFNVTTWGNQAVNCQKFLTKGCQVVVQGRLRQDRWEDKTTGKTETRVIIQSDNIQFLRKPENAGNASNASNAGNTSTFNSQSQNASQQNQNPWSQQQEQVQDMFGAYEVPNTFDDIPF